MLTFALTIFPLIAPLQPPSPNKNGKLEEFAI
jgi:hypothetical protein